ncbi:unnamed protein product [Phytophthora fragariaefolia]|uniref:Unnamed protein product n=1 Tax=Phytophthora fragariaefolia TaxID=1490495 RepID=A0A9W7CZP3_9STRA|nr:unnamed protein product [Phytophthora fragariaefolia]
MSASIVRLEEQTSQWRATSTENERLLQAAQRTIDEHDQDRDAIVRDRDSIARDRDSIARDRDSLAQDRDALAQGREIIVSDYHRLQEQYSNAYRRFDSAQINTMSSASDDGGRNAGSVTTEIDRPPKLSKGLDESPSSGVSESDPKEVEPEITMQDTNDTPPLEISELDKCESIEGKEAEDDGTDDEILSGLSRSRPSLRRRGSLTPDRGTHHVGGGSAASDLADATLEVDEIDDSFLFPTFVLRRLLIPGVCARLFRQSDTTPWDVYLVSRLRVSEIDVQTLSTLLTSVSEWLFPAIDPASHPLPDSYEHLFAGAAVNALMGTSPWSSLSNGEAPLIFIPAVSGRRLPHNFVQDYPELEE